MKVKAQDSISARELWRDMPQSLRQARLPYLLIVLATVIALARSKIALLIPSYMQQFYAGDFSTHIILLLIGTGILRYVISMVVDWINRLCAARITRNIRKSLVSRLFRMPVAFYEKNTPKSLISRTTDDTTKMSAFVSTVVADVISSVYGIAGVCALLFTYHWKLGTTMLLIIPVSITIFVLCGKLNFKVNFSVQGKLAELTKSIMERVLRLRLIKASVNEQEEEANGGQDIEEFYRTKLKFGVATSGISTLDMFNQYFRQVIVILVGFVLVRQEAIGADIFIAFYLFEEQLCGYLVKLMNKWKEFKGCQGCVRRISHIFSEPEEALSGKAPQEDGQICFDQVCFCYDDKQVLDHVSFRIPERQLTAIVGRSGAGKSTILKLISAYYPVQSGEIRIGSQNISALDKQQWRRSISYVSQEMQLFSGTIRENLLYGITRAVSESELQNALKTACADQFIAAFPKGLEEQVGVNGANLSGGQSRRLMIAHALLKGTNLLLLDEITANLDVESARAINKTIRSIAAEKTVLMVSHDMKAVADADNILVLDGGTVSPMGTHEDLMRTNDVYRQLQLAAGV